MTNHDRQTLAGRWQLDPERSRVEFRTRHVWGLITVRGRFEHYTGELDIDGTPAIELTIDAASVRTGNRIRDRHLRSADFFDTDRQPRVRFVSDSIDVTEQTLEVRGRLFARDRSIPLELEAQIRQDGEELAIETTTVAAHRELGMTYSPLGMIPPQSELIVSGYLVPQP